MLSGIVELFFEAAHNPVGIKAVEETVQSIVTARGAGVTGAAAKVPFPFKRLGWNFRLPRPARCSIKKQKFSTNNFGRMLKAVQSFLKYPPPSHQKHLKFFNAAESD